jgi:isocitrate dehydrogenase (NAD+)
MHKVTLLPGDGVGPEIAEATRKCVEATGVRIEWDVQECGIEVIEAKGGVPASVLESIRANGVALKAPITTPIGKGFRSVNVYLRQELGLYACVRPCKTYKGVRTFFDACNVDLVIVRENTEDLYAGVEFKAGERRYRKLIGQINAVATGKKITTDLKQRASASSRCLWKAQLGSLITHSSMRSRIIASPSPRFPKPTS